MSDDHVDALVLYCRHLADLPDTTAGTMTAFDRFGFEIVAVDPAGPETARVELPEPCNTREDVRQALVATVAEARSAAVAE